MTLNSFFVFLATAAASNAGVLVDWNLDTVTGPTTNTAFTGVSSSVATVAPNLAVSDLVSGFTPGFSGLNWSNFNTEPGKLNLWYWDSSNDTSFVTLQTGSGVPDNWLEFTITVDVGYQFTVDSIDLAAWRNAAGAPSNWRFDYFDGSAWQPFAAAHSQSTSGLTGGVGVFTDVAFNGLVTGEELKFRFVAYGTPGGTGVPHINDLAFNGTVAAVPESSAALLGGLGALCLLHRSRR